MTLWIRSEELKVNLRSGVTQFLCDIVDSERGTESKFAPIHAMKVYAALKAWLHSFFKTLFEVGGQLQASARFTPPRKIPSNPLGFNRMESSVGTRPSLEALKK